MRIYAYLILVFVFSITSWSYAQKPIDEEKVKKAVVLMQKMMTDPGQMQNIMAELQSLKLNSAENKEAQTRMQTIALKQAGEIKKQVTAVGGITENQITTFKENKDRIVPVTDEARINYRIKKKFNRCRNKKLLQSGA